MNPTVIDQAIEIVRGTMDLRPRRPSVSRDDEPPLWGFDEARERARFERVGRRLLQLEATLFGEFGTRFASGAREAVQRLFIACPSIRVPSISVQPDGQLICTWTNPRRERLTVRFAACDRMQFSLVRTAPGRPSVLHRHWGEFSEPASFWDENPVARRIAE